jgi:hypothetical protein
VIGARVFNGRLSCRARMDWAAVRARTICAAKVLWRCQTGEGGSAWPQVWAAG